MDKHKELQVLAQRSAEERLGLAVDLLMNEDDDSHPGHTFLAGPFCGCDVCTVREVLDAAWPFLKELALLEGPDESR